MAEFELGWSFEFKKGTPPCVVELRPITYNEWLELALLHQDAGKSPEQKRDRLGAILTATIEDVRGVRYRARGNPPRELKWETDRILIVKLLTSQHAHWEMMLAHFGIRANGGDPGDTDVSGDEKGEAPTESAEGNLARP